MKLMTSNFQKFTGGGGYKVVQVGGYKVRQVGGYKVSILRDFRMWGFIRSNRYFFVAAKVTKVTLFRAPHMGVYKVK